MVDSPLTFLHNTQLRVLALYNLLQLNKVLIQALDLIFVERNRLLRCLSSEYSSIPVP